MARPNLSYLKNLILFLYGLPLGTVTGLTAIAGSVFAVPAARSLLGLRPARAVGTGLAVTFFAAFASILSYAQHGYVLGGLAVLLAVCQIVGAAWGERLAARLPGLERLGWLWGTVVASCGVAILTDGLGYWHAHTYPFGPGLTRIAFFALAALLAALVGLVSRVIGVAGVLLVPALVYGLGLTPHASQGTTLVVLALASLPGMLIHARRGDVEPQGATWLSAGAVFGALSGALWAVSLPDRVLLVLFGLVTALLGVLRLWRRDAPPSPTPPELGAGG